MNSRENELIDEVASLVRGAMQAVAPAWRRATVQFQVADGCFSTVVSYAVAKERLPVDAVVHRTLFVRLQGVGRRLRQAAAHDTQAFLSCRVDIEEGGPHVVRLLRERGGAAA